MGKSSEEQKNDMGKDERRPISQFIVKISVKLAKQEEAERKV